MKRLHQTNRHVLMLLSSWCAQTNLLAELQPVIPRLIGVGAGSQADGYGTDVQVLGKLAFLSWGGDTDHPGGLEIFSVKDPAAPLRLGGYQSREPVNAIQVAGAYAYLAEGATRNRTNDLGALEIIDVSDPAIPVRVSGIKTLGRANDIVVSGSFAYVAGATHWTGTNLVGTLEIFDISSATNPIRVATFDTAGSITSVDFSNNHIFLTDGITDLQALDVTDPRNPQRVGVFNSDVAHNTCGFEPGGPATLVQVVGKLAYSAGDNGLHVLDITNPANPVSIGQNFCLPISGFHVSDDIAYALIWRSLLNEMFLYVANASNPANLEVVGRKENWGSGPIHVIGDLIFVAHYTLLVYQTSDRPTVTALVIHNQSVTLMWDFAPGFVLQRNTSFSNPQWSMVPNSDSITRMGLPKTEEGEFFRLARP